MDGFGQAEVAGEPGMAGRAETGRKSASSPGGRILPSLVVLLLLTLLPRIIAIARSVAPARDAFRYWDAANRFSEQPFVDAVRAIDAHPLYPLSLHGLRQFLDGLAGSVDSSAWFVACQCWSLLAYTCFIAFSFVLGVRLWSCRISFWGCLAVSCLPRQLAYSVDVLSDGLHAALFSGSLLAIGLSLESQPNVKVPRGTILKGGVGGLFAGMAFWTRPEGLLLPAIFLSVSISRQFSSKWRIPWPGWGMGVAAFLIPAMVMDLAYVGILGELSPKNSAKALLGATTQAEPTAYRGDGWLQLAVADPPSIEDGIAPPIPSGWLGAAWVLFLEIGQETRGWLLVFFLYSLMDRRRTRARMPRGLLVLFTLLGTAAMLLLLVRTAGFLASRYLTPCLPLFAMLAMTGVEAFVGRIADLPCFSWEKSWPAPVLDMRRRRVTFAVIAVVVVGLCVPRWLQPLHPHRSGHRAAADWLRAHAKRGEKVFDPVGMSSYFAGLPRWTHGSGDFRYAVIDSAVLARVDPSTRNMLERIDRSGRVVAHFSGNQTGGKRRVLVVEVPLFAEVSPRWEAWQ